MIDAFHHWQKGTTTTWDFGLFVLCKQSYFSQTGVESMLLLILRNVQVHPVIVTLSWISTACNFHPVLLHGAQGHCGKPNSTVNHITLPYSHVCSQGTDWLVWTATPIKHWERRVGSYESKTNTAVSDSGKLTLLSFCSLWWLFLLDLTEIVKKSDSFPAFYLRAGCVCWMNISKSSPASSVVTLV